MASVTKHLVLACSLLISYQVHGKSIGQTIADARQSVNEVASKVPLYVSSAAERVPQYAERVPQYVAKVPQYINRVPDYMGQLPQYVSGAVSQMPGIFNGATSRFPDMFQNTMRNAATEVSSAGNKLLKALGFKTKIGAAPAQSLVQGQQHQIIIQSPGYIGSPTYTVPMIPTDYKIKDGVKTLKSERPVASPLDTHAAAHAVQFGASASSSYDSYGPLYHNRHPSENEI